MGVCVTDVSSVCMQSAARTSRRSGSPIGASAVATSATQPQSVERGRPIPLAREDALGAIEGQVVLTL